MNQSIKIILIACVLICGISAIAWLAFLQIDFIGQKDPRVVEENLKRWNNTLLSAEYRNGTDYCKVELLDSVNILISVGDKSGGTIVNETYKISKDSIILIDVIKPKNRYLNPKKFLIHLNKLLFKIDARGMFDTTTAMDIKFNKIKL